MSITIQSPEGRPLTTVSLNRGAKAAFSLMEHEYIELPFKLTEPVNIPVGSYVETAGHFDEATAALLRPRYYVCKPQSPTWNERTGAFEYRLRLDAPHYLWNNFIFRYTPESTGAEASWTLTAPLDVQLGVFLRNLAALGFTHAGKPYTYVIHDTVENKAVAMTYDGTHLLDALYGMGDKEHWGCDVWVVDNAIHFGRCESGDPVRIELDAEARTMARSESKTDYATRLLVFGGTKNLPENYRAASPALTVNGVVQRRLMLPSGTPYVDVHPGRSVFGTVEQIVTFDDIYPRRTGTLSGVRTVDRTVKEGDKQTGAFKAYQYRDAGLTFKDDYVLKGQELRVVFQSGKLNGLHFAVQFNPEGKSPADQLWEIVANSDYGRLLPDETVRPADGDKYVLYGFDIRLVSDQYVPSAEQELKRRAEEYARRLAADDGTYTATLRGSWVDADPLRRTFAAGQRVRLVNPAFFPSDGRESRVIGWELNLDIPTDAPVYTFGESARYSRLADIEEKVDALVYKGTTYTGGEGSGVYVVRTNDSTPPSDSNVLSSLRALATFLRKDRPGSMPHLLTLLDGLETGTFAAGRTGGRIDRAGNGELGSLTLRDLLTAVRVITGDVRSKNYTPGDMGTGFGLTTGEGGSRLEVDYLLVRRVATFLELLIREMRHVGGTLVLSGASGKAVRVEDKPSAWRVHFKTREDGTTVAHGFTVGAQARCQTYNRTSGNTYYWRLVTATGDDWVELSKSDYDKAAPTGTARTAPAVGDELVQLGHRTDSRQTGAIVLDTVGEGAPSIRLLTGIRSYSLTDANVRVLLSPTAVRVIADEVSFASGKSVEETITDSGKKAIEEAKSYVNGIQQKLTDSLNKARTELEKHAADLDAALLSSAQTYADGQVTESEKRMIEDNRKKLQAEQEEATRRLNEAIADALSTAKGYVKDVQVGGRNYFGQHKDVATDPAGALSPDNNGVVFRNRGRLNCRIKNLNLPGVGWYAVSMFIRATKACTIASINLCDAVSKDRTLENVSVTTSFRYITGVFHAERYINDNVWNGFLDFESSIDPSIEVTVRDLMITPGNQPMSWVPAPEDLYADIAAKAKAAQDAAKKYTEEQDRYYQTLQNSYADGQIEESEKRMIKDAEAKLQAAKEDAQTKADEALIAAKQHTNAIKDTLNSSITDAKNTAQNVQTNLDNLTIGGRNLLRYSALEKTPLNNIVYGRKPENAPVGVEEGYQGAKAVKLVFTTPGKPSVSEVMWHTWEERTDHNRVEPVVLRFWAKADKDNTRMWTVLGYHGGKIARPTISSEWKEYTVNFMPDGPWALWCIGLDAPGTVWISRPKLEYGTKPTDWTPAPEDVDNSIAGVRNTANQASNDAGDAKQKAGEAATSASKAESSAKNAEASANAAKGKATEAAGSAKTASDKANEAAGSASAAAGSAQTAATDAAKAKADADAAAQSAKASKEAADAAKTRLDSWAADNVISPMEKQGLRDETARIDADKSQVAAGYAKYGLGSYQAFTDAYNAYRAVLVTLSSTKQETIGIPADFATKQRNYYTQRSTALTRIADAAKEYVDGLQIGGRNLLKYARLIFIPETYAYGRGSYTTAVDTATLCEGQRSLKVTASKVGSVGGTDNFVWEAWNVVRQSECVTVSFYAKAATAGTRFSVRMGGDVCDFPQTVSLSTDWQRFEMTFREPGRKWMCIVAWYDRAGTVWIALPKMELGSRATDWTPAPEDIASEIAAKTEAARQAAQAEAIGLNKWIAQAFYTGENNAATPPKLEDIAGKTPTRTVELKDAQFNLSGNGSVFNMDLYTGIRTTYVYLDADYNLTTGIQHDDAGALYVNGALVASGGFQGASWKSVTLPLKRGWNRIDGLWNEGTGGDYFKFQAPLENDAHIIQLACRPNVSIDPMRAVTMKSVEEQKAGFNTFNKQFTAWSQQTEKTLTEYNNGLTKLTQRVTDAELDLTHDKIWMGISEKVTSTVDDRKTTLVNELKSKTGIDIQQGVITLDAQKVKVQNGKQTMAMFEGGKLKADLIDVDKIFSKDITVTNNATITNLRAKNAVIEGKLEAASGSTIGGMTGYSSYLGFETQRGTASERILHIGTQAIPLSTGFHGMLYLTDKQRDAFKTIVYIESLGKEEKRWNLADARAHNKAIHIASGTLRVDPGNLVDMPGVLLSGRVSETGYVEYEYGRRRMGMGLAAFSVQLHDGRDWVGYTITHNLGHTNYTVQATPYTPGWNWRKYMVHVDQLTANYFTLLCIDTGTDNRQVKGSFMFTVVGENTAD